jgi:two-component system, chemotaxis family, sensor kinase CheA
VDVARYAELFRTESHEQLAAMDGALLAMERGTEGEAPLRDFFRSAHSLKGMSASMGFTALGELAHDVEAAVEPWRDRGAPPAALLDVLFRATDALRAAVEAALRADEPPRDLAALRAELRAGVADPAHATQAPVPTAADAVVAPVTRWRPTVGVDVQVTLAPDCVMPGVRALLVLRAAEALGAVLAVSPPRDALADLSAPEPIDLVILTDAPPTVIAGYLRRAGEVADVVVRSAEDAAAAQAVRTVRIDVARLDRLLDVAGELTLVRGQLERAMRGREAPPALAEAVLATGRLIGAVQHEVLAARLVPVGQAFDRFPRLVRDAAHATGKSVRLVIEGSEIELDRALVDALGEPLVHLLRNAVDHGIEPPALRESSGKPGEGEVRLSATRDRNAVILRVQDDGGGIDREAVAAKAIRRRVLDAEAGPLDDAALMRVLATPGFSMAAAVSAISGRGVGLDTVLARVRQAGGTVQLESRIGEGTTWTLRLPISVAIVRALLVRVADHSYAFPLAYVRETLEVGDPAAIRAGVLAIRGALVPLVSARALMQLEPDEQRRPQVVLVERRGSTVGVLVDAVIGQDEIVVEPLDALRGARPLFNGATILADGTIALIFDAGSLL